MYSLRHLTTKAVVVGVGVALVGLFLAVPTAVAATTTLYAAVNGTSTSCTSAVPCTLTQAVSTADSGSGDTVVVEAGTYTLTGPITISSSMTLMSATGNSQTTGTIITGNTGTTGEAFRLYNSSSPGSGVSGVTIEGFRFQRLTGGTYGENGVVHVGGNGAGNVTVAHNSFTANTDAAIGYHGNPGLTGPLGTGWTVTDNVVTGVNGEYGSGMWFGNLSKSTISDNTITNTNYAGIILTATSNLGEAFNTVSGNTVRNVQKEGIQIAFGQADTVSGNTVAHAGQSGTKIGKDCALCLYNPDQANITITGNTLIDSYQGFAIGQTSGSLGYNGEASEITFGPNNAVAGNIAGGVDNNATSGGSLLAQNDWWGCSQGPSSPGCDAAIGNVTFNPFLVKPPTPGSVAANATVSAGTLGFVAPVPNIAFGTNLNGRNQTMSTTLSFNIGDATGSGAGWKVTATSTQFTSGSHTLASDATTVGTAPAVSCDTGVTCTTASNSVSYPYVLPAGTTAPTATAIFNAGAGTGMGDQTVTTGFSVALPANVYAGSYSATWTFSLISGP